MKPRNTAPRNRLHKRALTALLFLVTALTSPAAHSQGCTQCKDNAAATPPATQRAYRNAILLLTVTAGGIFVAAVTLIRRNQ
jgi:hypothetical protein